MNADARPPSAVAQFVSRHLDSVAELEALLLVHGTPGERWDVRRVARRLYISDADARLVCTGFITGDWCRMTAAGSSISRDTMVCEWRSTRWRRRTRTS